MSGDFIEVYDDALDAETCAALIRRFEAGGQATRGQTGGGVDVRLKDSWDILIDDHPDWQDAKNRLNAAMMGALMTYVRKYPYTVLAPLALRIPDGEGRAILLDPSSLRTLSDARLRTLLFRVFRPGTINIQKYVADQGGYPYWHSELYPKAGDGAAETLHRVLLWSVYLNDDFAEGETEFFHQGRGVKPRTGSLLIAPAGATHTHRGV